MLNQISIITLLLGLALIILAISINLIFYKYYKVLTSFHIASLFYVFIFAIVPIYFIFNPEYATEKMYYYYFMTDAPYNIALLALAEYIILFMSYLFGAKIKSKKEISYENKPIPIKKYSYWAFI